MTESLSTTIFVAFAVFCRVGACLMILPGISSRHIPMRIRLFIAIGVSLCLTPALLPTIQPVLEPLSEGRRLSMVSGEILVGVFIGLLGRLIFLALEFCGAVIASSLGYAGPPGAPIEETEPATPLSSLIVLGATVLVFTLDLHLEAIKALFATYQIIDFGIPPDPAVLLRQQVHVVGRSFELALQLCGPFIVYSITANFVFGVLNKLVPQIPVFFISMPFIIAGGLAMIVLIIPELLEKFGSNYGRWISDGVL